jgi:hypothetical protein
MPWARVAGAGVLAAGALAGGMAQNPPMTCVGGR